MIERSISTPERAARPLDDLVVALSHESGFPVAFPPPSLGLPAPRWTGRGFAIGAEHHAIVEYSSDSTGWDDALTAVHEDSAGSDHPIDIASRESAIRALKRYMKSQAGTILEVGCSSGYLLPLIRQAFPTAAVFGADVVKTPLLKLAERMPDLPLLRFDLARCPLPDSCVDAVVMLNVLEHIGNDALALSQVNRILKPGGIFVLEVPAGPSLYDYYDAYLRHYRRYDRAMLKELSKKGGLDVRELSHIGFFIYPAFWLVKKLNRLRVPADSPDVEHMVKRQIQRSSSSAVMKLAMKLEDLGSQYLNFDYPVGIRCTGTFAKR